ncbi:VirB4 family type IV secretion system protein [Holdemania massiliensis]|uniref:VirB4 family type IV secretion system protein n=1 Tax=Holdemania massiliensis TaxID=1468449 RepID=UPI001F071020|nr:hypothetical protein [Holdemania massiliensis]MCH1942420.1 hypothetical protein [Holdemania massiliensis]
MKNNIELVKRSKLVPTSFRSNIDYYMIGDLYITNLLVMQLPRSFGLGMLCEYVSNPNIKVFMRTEPLDTNIAALLKKDYQEKEQEYQKTKDPSLQKRIADELTSLNTYIEENIKNNDSTHNVVIVFSVQSDDLKEMKASAKDLKLRLSAVGFKVQRVTGMQEMLLKEFTPLWIDSKLPKTISDNLGVPLPSTGLAGMYPYVFETLKDPKGFLLGRELQNSGAIVFDPYYYIHNKKQAAAAQRMNGNAILLGKSGSGKTTTLNLIVRFLIKNKVRLVWIDPENKNITLTRKYGGTFVNWGTRNACINVFDLKPISSEEEEQIDMWDTELAIINVIDDVKQVIKYLFPETSTQTLSCIGDLVFKTFEKVGIKKNDDGTFDSFESLTSTDMPRFTTMNEVLMERIGEIKNDAAAALELQYLNELKLDMKSILTEWKMYFDNYTTIQINETEHQIISFGTKQLYQKPQNLREALNHIMYQYAWSLCLDDRYLSAFLYDEAHVGILEGKSAELIAQFTRRSRKYYNIMILATQEPKDFADEKVLTHGKAIFNNSVYKIIMNLDLDSVCEVSKLVRLNDSEQGIIQEFSQGEALFICGDRRIPISVLCTDAELQEFGA